MYREELPRYWRFPSSAAATKNNKSHSATGLPHFSTQRDPKSRAKVEMRLLRPPINSCQLAIRQLQSRRGSPSLSVNATSWSRSSQMWSRMRLLTMIRITSRLWATLTKKDWHTTTNRFIKSSKACRRALGRFRASSGVIKSGYSRRGRRRKAAGIFKTLTPWWPARGTVTVYCSKFELKAKSRPHAAYA